MKLALVPDHHPRRIRPYGLRRRMEALAALGWPIREQERRLGHPNVFCRLAWQQYIQRSTAEAIKRLYSDLWDQMPSDTYGSRRARAWAARLGWPRPAEWDDEHIDLPPDELAAAITREVESMSYAELRRCQRDRDEGGRGPLAVAGAREYRRQKSARRRERERGSAVAA
ncbi:hypothetical protein HII36_54410 [Nonomuraea sp. NN258]|uniref:hypothetical protein n=1 Tax=Nonomuraea antri TaxID=2730852 RepID=UPI0015693291|nr:hypothetical protein [Nonomuraea antri]NRQ40745.1 hypothetical protein [Nonomuraea antri]